MISSRPAAQPTKVRWFRSAVAFRVRYRSRSGRAGSMAGEAVHNPERTFGAEIPREPRLMWRSPTVVAGFDISARGAVVSVSIRFRLAALLCPPSTAIHGRPAIYRLGI